ncbi:unnamed protein product [Brachionus calyciflorus]|uniref:MULE transposase domain-containing protein n=1 Tax=Brachionus calyciflorus TaxID=104777 RepID=A0A813M575_9BILA|nr:unnamed protein product [Brachionus calyciflorus]
MTLQFIKKVKIHCSTEIIGSNKIFEEDQTKLYKTLTSENEKNEVASLIRPFHSIKASLQKRKNFFKPKLPNSVAATIVEGRYAKCANGIDNFLIYKTKKNKKLVFCSKIGLEILSQSDEWHADGTFDVAAKYFNQLYLIQACFKTENDRSFPIELWNHYDTVGPRTNNNLEGLNNKLKTHVSSIYKSIELFQTQETNAFVKYRHALENKPAQPRKKLDIGKDNELRIYKKMLEEKNIDIEVYIKYILPLFSFNKKKSDSNDEKDSDSEDEDEDIVESSDEEDQMLLIDIFY